jgi:hypothetical protein
MNNSSLISGGIFGLLDTMAWRSIPLINDLTSGSYKCLPLVMSLPIGLWTGSVAVFSNKSNSEFSQATHLVVGLTGSLGSDDLLRRMR